MVVLLADALLPSLILCAENSRIPGLRSISPVPSADRVLPETNIILRLERTLAATAPGLRLAIAAVGSTSGVHGGRVTISSDRRTVLFKPDRPFAYGERVTVELSAPAVPNGPGRSASSFTIATGEPPRLNSSMLGKLISDVVPNPSAPATPLVQAPRLSVSANQDSLPSDLPVITATVYGKPARGRLFLSNVSFFGPSDVPYLLIVDDHGTPTFYRRMQGTCLDFNVQPDGHLTYFDTAGAKFYVMDDAYAIVDSFTCGNGYPTDLHELRLLPDGHALLMSYDPQTVDMSQLVPGGDSAAVVFGLIVQEVDDQANVFFQWRSWDHFEITEATDADLTAHEIDYVHGNAIEVDADGNLLISSRHLSEITKIDRETGEIMWRWGGKKNQFTFLGDTLGFSYQHAIRRLPNGHYTLYDNGVAHDPPFSRALEYELDQTAKTARLVWQYSTGPNWYGFAMGYVQRLENGNTLISTGAGKPDLFEVTPSGDKVMEMSLPNGIYTYRAYRYARASDPPPDAELGAPLLMGMAPNPTRDQGVMTLNLEIPAKVSLAVYDLSGREVARLLDETPYPAGMHLVPIDLSRRRPGLYFVKATAGTRRSTQKVLRLR